MMCLNRLISYVGGVARAFISYGILYGINRDGEVGRTEVWGISKEQVLGEWLIETHGMLQYRTISEGIKDSL